VDDGSTDESRSLCLEYSKRYSFISVLCQENSGPSAARNHGLRYARGEYVAFLDSDDYVSPELFAQRVNLLAGESADIWASDFRRVADNGCVLDEVNQIKSSPSPILDREYLPEFLAAKDCVWNVWRYIFRREFLDKKQLRFAEGYNIAEDLEFVVRALSAAESFAFFHTPYYFYRVNYGLSLTRSYTLPRVQQLMAMLKKARLHLGDGRANTLLKEKLSREYILNLSLLWEVPKADRAETLHELKSARELLVDAAGVYAVAAKVVGLIGIPLSAAALYSMKIAKRLVRSIKTGLFSGGKDA